MKKIMLSLHSLTNPHCWVRLSCTRSPLHSSSDLGITWSPTPHSWPTLCLPRELLLTQQLTKTQFHEDMMSSGGIRLQANVETGSHHEVQLPGHQSPALLCFPPNSQVPWAVSLSSVGPLGKHRTGTRLGQVIWHCPTTQWSCHVLSSAATVILTVRNQRPVLYISTIQASYTVQFTPERGALQRRIRRQHPETDLAGTNCQPISTSRSPPSDLRPLRSLLDFSKVLRLKWKRWIPTLCLFTGPPPSLRGWPLSPAHVLLCRWLNHLCAPELALSLWSWEETYLNIIWNSWAWYHTAPYDTM